MLPAARLQERLEGIALRKPGAPVVQNRDVAAFDDPARIRQALVEQLYNPVRWIETVQYLANHGVTRMVECGPGKVLAGLSRRIAPGAVYATMTESAALAAALPQD